MPENITINSRPNVMVIIAPKGIDGPAKGLLQFVEYAPRDEFDITAYDFCRDGSFTDPFSEQGMRVGLSVKFFGQRAPLDLSLFTQVTQAWKEGAYNILQTHGYKADLLGLFLKRKVNCKWVAFAHGYTWENKKIAIYNKLDMFSLRFPDLVISVSNKLADMLANSGVSQQKICIIHNAVDAPSECSLEDIATLRERLGIQQHDLVLGAVGRLSPEKGHKFFLDALRRLSDLSLNFKAIIIGDGQERNVLQKFCKNHQLGDRVIFVGYQHKVAPFYKIMDLFVLPSLSEGLPNALLEAMSHGIPVIGTEVGDVSEVISSSKIGVLVPPGDNEALTDAIQTLLSDPSKRKLLGQIAQYHVQRHFSPAKRANQIASLYSKLLTGKKVVECTRWNF